MPQTANKWVQCISTLCVHLICCIFVFNNSEIVFLVLLLSIYMLTTCIRVLFSTGRCTPKRNWLWPFKWQTTGSTHLIAEKQLCPVIRYNLHVEGRPERIKEMKHYTCSVYIYCWKRVLSCTSTAYVSRTSYWCVCAFTQNIQYCNSDDRCIRVCTHEYDNCTTRKRMTKSFKWT